MNDLRLEYTKSKTDSGDDSYTKKLKQKALPWHNEITPYFEHQLVTSAPRRAPIPRSKNQVAKFLAEAAVEAAEFAAKKIIGKFSRSVKQGDYDYIDPTNLPSDLSRWTNPPTNKPTKAPVVSVVTSPPTKAPVVTSIPVGPKTNAPVIVQTTQGPVAVVPLAKPSYKPGKALGTYVMGKSGKMALSTMSSRGISTKRAPAAFSRRMNISNKPVMSASSKGINVRHKEYMTNIMSNATTLSYFSEALILNPGKINAFPWLSTIAGNFDKYKINRLTITLVSNQPTTTAGRIGVGIDYDSTDPMPVDRTEFFSLTHHVECSAWDSITFNVPLQGGVRFINSHTNTDSKLIDYGQIIIMADQVVTTGTAIDLGDAIIDYDIDLIDPQQAVMLTQSFTGTNPADFTKLEVTGPLIASIQSTISATVVDFKFAVGKYIFNEHIRDSAAASPVGNVTALTGIVGKKYGLGNTISYTANGVFTCNTDGAIVRITFSGAAFAGLETVSISFTRISAAVEQKLRALVWTENM